MELAYAATVDSAQGVTVDRTVAWVGQGMGRTRLYSAATRGRQAPVYVTEAATPTEATERVRAAIHRDDLAATMQELLQATRTPSVTPSEDRSWPNSIQIVPVRGTSNQPPRPSPQPGHIRMIPVGGEPKMPPRPTPPPMVSS